MQQQYSEEEIFGINLDKNYECFGFIDDEGNSIYFYDRIRDDL